MRGVVEHVDGDDGVTVSEDKYGIRVAIMDNGSQWCSVPVNEKLLMMMQCAIAQFLNNKDKK